MSQAWIDAATNRVRALMLQAGCSGVEAVSQLASELAADLVFTHPKNALAIWKQFEDTLGVKEIDVLGPPPVIVPSLDSVKIKVPDYV